MANNTFNPVQEMQYTGYNPSKLSDRDKFLIEALLADSGVISAVGMPQTPGPLPAPTPTPTPTPTPAPAPTPSPAPQAPTQGSGFTANVILQLALTKVKPGDLITPDFANNLIDAYMALDARVRLLEGMGKTTAPTPTPTAPTPTPTPTPSSSAEVALTGGGRSAPAARPAPTIESVTATTVRGKGVTIVVTGDNMSESVVERVLLGATAIASASIKFSRSGFTFLTTTAIVSKAKNRLTVVTSDGEDSAPITAKVGAPER